MFETVLAVIVTLFAVIGMAYLVMCLVLLIGIKSDPEKTSITLMLSGKNADMELISVIERRNWDSAFRNICVFAVDCGLEPDTADACKRIVASADCVMWLNRGEYMNLIKEKLET